MSNIIGFTTVRKGDKITVTISTAEQGAVVSFALGVYEMTKLVKMLVNALANVEVRETDGV